MEEVKRDGAIAIAIVENSLGEKRTLRKVYAHVQLGKIRQDIDYYVLEDDGKEPICVIKINDTMYHNGIVWKVKDFL